MQDTSLKPRASSLKTLVGHELQMERLRRSVEQGRVASAYLLVGPDGIGKTTLARWFAQLLSCEAEVRPCGVCARCQRLAEGASPDLTVLEEASHPYTLHSSLYPDASRAQIDAALATLHEVGLLARPARGFGDVRICHLAVADSAGGDLESELYAALRQQEPGSLVVRIARVLFLRGSTVRYVKAPEIKAVRRYVIQQVPLRPVEMRYRMFIVDDAHTLRVDAQNALLKTLEEPPPSSVLVLVTSRPNGLLPTIASRCQTLVLRGLARPVMAELLGRMGADPEDARLAAELAHGSVLQALDFDPAEHRQRRDALLDALLAEPERASRVQALVAALQFGATADRQERQRLMARQLELLLELLRDALALQGGGSADLLRHGEAAAGLRALAALGAARLTRLAELVLDGLERTATNASADLQALALGSRLHETLGR
jgi:DNA polymerase-3 subunit delta'